MAVTRFWVGGTGTFDSSTTTHWAATSGGAGGASVPGSIDTATFDGNSGAPVVTTSGAQSIAALNLSTGFTGSLVCGAALTVSGAVTHVQGTLNTAGFAQSWGSYSNTGTLTRTLTMGASAIAIIGTGSVWSVASATGMTLTANTATVTFSGVAANITPGGVTYSGTTFVINSTGTFSIVNSGTISNLTYAPTAGNANVLSIAAAALIISTALHLTGSVAPNRPAIISSVIGTQRTLTCNGTVTVASMDFQDIKGAGTASWNLSAVSSGDCGGNATITFATAQTNYWQSPVSSAFSTVARWFLATNGGGGAGRVPLPQDTAVFDVNSTATFSVALDTVRYGTVIATGFTGVLSSTITTSCFGNWTNGSGMTITGSGAIIFAGRGSQTLTSAGVSFSCFLLFNGFGGTYALQDGLTVPSTISVTLTSGTLNTNGQACSWGLFIYSATSTAALTLGTSIITITGVGTPWNIGSAGGLTTSFTSSTLVFNNTSGSSITASFNAFSYGTINVTGTTGTFSFQGTPLLTCVNFNYSPGAARLNNLNINNTNGMLITGTFTVTAGGGTVSDRTLVTSNTLGTAKPITCNGTNVFDTVDFRDIAAAGTASWNLSAITNGAGDCGGNTGITFTTAQTNYYKAAGAANWSTAANWFLATNGTGGAGRMPLPQDTAIFDSNSGANTYTFDRARVGSITSTGFTGTLSVSSIAVLCFGNWINGAGTTISGTLSITFSGVGAQTITNNGTQFGVSIVIGTSTGTYTLQDSLVTAGSITMSVGTFTLNNFNVTSATFVSGASATTVNMGSGTWTLTAVSGNIWAIGGVATTINAGTSSIVIGTASAASRFIGGGGSTPTYSTISYTVAASSGSLTFTTPCTIGTLTVMGDSTGKTLTLPSGVTVTITNALNINGVLSKAVNIIAVTPTSAATFSAASSVVINVSNVSITDNTATGGAAFDAWGASTLNTDVTGWTLLTALGSISLNGGAADFNALSSGGISITGSGTASISGTAATGAVSLSGTVSPVIAASGAGQIFITASVVGSPQGIITGSVVLVGGSVQPTSSVVGYVVLAAAAPVFRYNTVGHQQMNVAVQPALTPQQQSLSTTVQPALS